MSRHPSDSFLPSGGVEQRLLNRHGSLISPTSQTPRTVPSAEYIQSPYLSGTVSPVAATAGTGMFSPSQRPPMSPPKTRPESAEESAAVMVENYRKYAATLRAQTEGERAHMIADRARMEEVMAAERAVWDEERALMQLKISQLELALKDMMSLAVFSPQTTINNHRPTTHPRISSMASTTGSVDSIRSVPQESGRNADGSPFYAPAPRQPSRTFDTSEHADMRVDDITAPRETPICVTSKELTSSDFVQTSSGSYANEQLETIKETTAESIDIQLIQPELDGVPIKASAVNPSFVAHILSPRRGVSPQVSPGTKAPSRPGCDISNGVGRMSPEEKEKMLLHITSQPENRRLTMHAGHTPNHSMSFPIILNNGGESGEATPKQEVHDLDSREEATPKQKVRDLDPREEIALQESIASISESLKPIHRGNSIASLSGLVEPTHTVDHLTPLPEAEDESDDASIPDSVSVGYQTSATDDEDNGDKALTGILGLTSNTTANDAFLEQLSKKLEVVARDASPDRSAASRPLAFSNRSLSLRKQNSEVEADLGTVGSIDDDEEDGKEAEAPRLKLKPSMNFGRPMGRM